MTRAKPLPLATERQQSLIPDSTSVSLTVPVAGGDAVDAPEAVARAADTFDQLVRPNAKRIMAIAGMPGAKGVLKKPNPSVVIRPVTGDLSLLTKKAWNILLYHAQQQGIEQNKRYSIPLAVFVADARFNSNDTELFKQRARAMISSTVEWGWRDQPPLGQTHVWKITSMLADLVIERLDPNAGDLTVTWSYSSVLNEYLLKTEEYTKMSIALMARFRSFPALTLFEIASRYRSNPSGVGKKLPWEQWVPILKGKPFEEHKGLDYRRFKRETLTPAAIQVNAEVSDFAVSWLETKAGRRVTHVQLVLTKKAGGRHGKSEDGHGRMDLGLFNRLISLGIQQSTAEVIYDSTSESVLREALVKTEARATNSKLEPLKSPEAYLKECIRNGMQAENEEGRSVQAPLAPPPDISRAQVDSRVAQLKQKYKDANLQKARRHLDQATPEQRQELLDEFAANKVPSLPAKFQTMFASKQLEAAPIRSIFLDWLAARNWESDPSPNQLIAFAIETGLLTVLDQEAPDR